MSEENLAVVEPAPEQVATAVPETEVIAPEAEAPKTFSQEELDAAIGKRLAREQRKWERERQPAPAVAAGDEGKVPDPLHTFGI